LSDASTDPLVREIREQITEIDRRLVETLNERLELVARLKAYKEARGYDFVDAGREQWMIDHLTKRNRGPLSTEGLRHIYGEIVALGKREIYRIQP
jgi:chorismate mutase